MSFNEVVRSPDISNSYVGPLYNHFDYRSEGLVVNSPPVTNVRYHNAHLLVEMNFWHHKPCCDTLEVE
jgi:hypothetical protein